METETCRHGHTAPTQVLMKLPESQGGLGRHKCASCAYKLGIDESAGMIQSHGNHIRCSHGNVAPESILRDLRESQGGSGRHKCVICAYQFGRGAGRNLPVDQAWRPRVGSENHVLHLIGAADFAHEPVVANVEMLSPQRLKEIGNLGELIVIEYEKASLLSAGEPNLANQVTHVAITEGDGAGYDVRSYEPNGTTKHIEVKTTTGSAATPFYLTENELRFARDNIHTYYLYRLFALDETQKQARCVVFGGEPEGNFILEPTMYRVRFRS